MSGQPDDLVTSQVLNPERGTISHDKLVRAVDDAWTLLRASIDMRALFICPYHAPIEDCRCAARDDSDPAQRATKYSRLTFGFFRHSWDCALLHDHMIRGSWTPQSHVAAAREALAARAQQFANSDLREIIFIYNDQGLNTVELMCAYAGAARELWQQTYASPKQAATEYLKDTYDGGVMGDEAVRIFSGLSTVLDSIPAGDVVFTYKASFGPPQHKSSIQILPFHFEDGVYTVQLLSVRLCHDDCARVQGKFTTSFWKAIVNAGKSLSLLEDEEDANEVLVRLVGCEKKYWGLVWGFVDGGVKKGGMDVTIPLSELPI